MCIVKHCKAMSVDVDFIQKFARKLIERLAYFNYLYIDLGFLPCDTEQPIWTSILRWNVNVEMYDIVYKLRLN